MYVSEGESCREFRVVELVEYSFEVLVWVFVEARCWRARSSGRCFRSSFFLGVYVSCLINLGLAVFGSLYLVSRWRVLV